MARPKSHREFSHAEDRPPTDSDSEISDRRHSDTILDFEPVDVAGQKRVYVVKDLRMRTKLISCITHIGLAVHSERARSPRRRELFVQIFFLFSYDFEFILK